MSFMDLEARLEGDDWKTGEDASLGTGSARYRGYAGKRK